MSYTKLRLPYFKEVDKRLFEIYIKNRDIEGLDMIFNQVLSKAMRGFIDDLKIAKRGIGGNDALVDIPKIYRLIEKYESFIEMI